MKSFAIFRSFHKNNIYLVKYKIVQSVSFFLVKVLRQQMSLIHKKIFLPNGQLRSRIVKV